MNVYAPKQHARIHIFLFLGRGVRGIIFCFPGFFEFFFGNFSSSFSEILQCDFINLNFEKKKWGGGGPYRHLLDLRWSTYNLSGLSDKRK